MSAESCYLTVRPSHNTSQSRCPQTVHGVERQRPTQALNYLLPSHLLLLRYESKVSGTFLFLYSPVISRCGIGRRGARQHRAAYALTFLIRRARATTSRPSLHALPPSHQHLRSATSVGKCGLYLLPLHEAEPCGCCERVPGIGVGLGLKDLFCPANRPPICADRDHSTRMSANRSFRCPSPRW